MELGLAFWLFTLRLLSLQIIFIGRGRDCWFVFIGFGFYGVDIVFNLVRSGLAWEVLGARSNIFG